MIKRYEALTQENEKLKKIITQQEAVIEQFRLASQAVQVGGGIANIREAISDSATREVLEKQLDYVIAAIDNILMSIHE